MKIEDTRIAVVGVFRCCVETVATEYKEGQEVQIGDKSKCQHCYEKFTLIQEKDYAIWTPDEQIKKEK